MIDVLSSLLLASAIAILCYLAARVAIYQEFMDGVRAAHARQEALLTLIARALRVVAGE